MRILILTDIHANWEALEAVIDDARGHYDESVCLGDLVGYGASPGEVVDWVRKNVGAVIRGNHDKAVAGLELMEDFNILARAAVQWTRAVLSQEQIEYLRALPEGPLVRGDVSMAHGSPLDEDEYLLNIHDVLDIPSHLPEMICFVGHTHVQGGFLWQRGRPERLIRPAAHDREAVLKLAPATFHLLNPGSVGQPRDGDPRAAYVIYDSHARAVHFRRTSYDIAKAQRKILDAGLPELLAGRLALGR